MRNGLYILTLGRQSFEPPASDPTPEPAPPPPADAPPDSAALADAQNEVLLTVGELLRGSSKPHPSHASLIRENELGLMVSTADLTLNYINTWPLVAIQNRIQVFRRYAGMNFLDVWRMEWRHGITGMYAGCISDLAFQVGHIIQDVARARFMEWFEKLTMRKRKALPETMLSNIVNKAFNWTVWCVFLYPLYRYTTLQSLHIIPARPVLPPPSFFLSSFSHLNPRNIIFSPFLPVSLYAYAAQRVRDRLYVSVRSILPKPDNPTSASTAATLEFEGEIDVGDSGEHRQRPRRRQRGPIPGEELVEVIEPPTNIILSDIDSGQQYTVAVPPPVRPAGQQGSRNEQDLTPPASPRNMSRTSTNEDLEVEDAVMPPWRPGVSDVPLHPATPETPPTHTTGTPMYTPIPASSSSLAPASTPLTPSPNHTSTHVFLDSHSDFHDPHANSIPQTYQPIPESESLPPISNTSTPIPRPLTPPLTHISNLTVETVELEDRAQHLAERRNRTQQQPNGDAALERERLEQIERDRERKRKESEERSRRRAKHKVTTLTVHPAESAAFHIADGLSRIACIALETYMLRAVAGAWLGAEAGVVVWGVGELGRGVVSKLGWAFLLDAAVAAVSWEGVVLVCNTLI